MANLLTLVNSCADKPNIRIETIVEKLKFMCFVIRLCFSFLFLEVDNCGQLCDFLSTCYSLSSAYIPASLFSFSFLVLFANGVFAISLCKQVMHNLVDLSDLYFSEEDVDKM